MQVNTLRQMFLGACCCLSAYSYSCSEDENSGAHAGVDADNIARRWGAQVSLFTVRKCGRRVRDQTVLYSLEELVMREMVHGAELGDHSSGRAYIVAIWFTKIQNLDMCHIDGERVVSDGQSDLA